MNFTTATRFILITWGVMGTLYALSRGRFKARLLQRSVVVQLTTAQASVPQSDWFSGAGTLWVFMANIITCGLLIATLGSPALAAWLETVRVDLPLNIHIIGGALFVAAQAWGLGAMIYNPHYTPLYKPLRREFILATRGPYAVMRHPRYAAEAALNVTLFLFTGVWLPLLGLLGWWGMARQAADEEYCLLAVVGEPYRKYCRKTGMFVPRIRKEA